MVQKAIEHMNSGHLDVIIAFCKKFGGVENPTNAKITNMNEEGLNIKSDDVEFFVPFLQKVENNNYKDAIIKLYSSIKDDTNNDKIERSLAEFIDTFSSVIISSIKDGQAISSYAPFIKENGDFYICVSSVAKHYEAMLENPNNISIFFIQDEKDASSLFARVRASFEASAELVDDKFRNEYFAKFEATYPNESALSFIKNMQDFHIIRLTPKKGRFVKGFGAAYDTNGFKITSKGRVNNPHIKK
ncbi:HugZ family heme oxygenase [Campylobacter sp. FMV-PI01]|uniref:HugZ family heme oxygenase n=1 Tax=Campylobacter portucalensis TaxID=2608384 RepID=A0A6L5WK14_9BACT|nr:HugZ family heme oxygenase [Campylobacter portucalensis]MSN96193.1 HugZ family heme oxygenase [Campylobacter portucalensis]